jgi:hypothetical protein
MLRRFVITTAVCTVAAACGAANPSQEVGPSVVTTIAPSTSGGTQLEARSIGSCPDGNAPNWLQPWTKATTARLRWTEVAPVIDYHVIVERYDVTNTYVPVENGNVMVSNTNWLELTLSEGRYRARIQTKSCGRYMGPWSEDLQFSVDGDEKGTLPGNAATFTESAEGARVFPNTGQSITDATGTVWTFGTEVMPGFYQILRNGVFTNGWGEQMKYHNHALYHLGEVSGAAGPWYVWNGDWTFIGTTEP